MDIEAIVKKHSGSLWLHERPLRTALTELSESHAIELRAYEATVANLEERIRELEAAKAEWQPIETAPKGKHVLVAKDNKDGTFSYQLAIFSDFAIKLWRKPCWHGPRYPLVWEPEFWMQVPRLKVQQQQKKEGE